MGGDTALMMAVFVFEPPELLDGGELVVLSPTGVVLFPAELGVVS